MILDNEEKKRNFGINFEENEETNSRLYGSCISFPLKFPLF